ncbi:MAG: hypothetical protein ACI92C_002808, partial [Neolewinella sp.]
MQTYGGYSEQQNVVLASVGDGSFLRTTRKSFGLSAS